MCSADLSEWDAPEQCVCSVCAITRMKMRSTIASSPRIVLPATHTGRVGAKRK